MWRYGLGLAMLAFGAAQSGRYWDSLFRWRIQEVQYGQARNINGLSQNLWATFYLPEPDAERQRPIVVLLFGGAYVSGSRRDSDITHIARYFAVRGYVCATIDYRIGLAGLPSAREWINASLRAMHDLKAFIRYLKRSVTESGNPWGIDTNRIYVGGSSAGAFTALHAAFLTQASELAEVPQADLNYLASQGGIEGNSGNPGYSSRFQAVFSLSGGMLRTSWIQPGKVTAVVAMHGTADAVVPYNRGLLPAIQLPAEGGYAIDSAARAAGLYHDLFSWLGAGHVPYGTQQSVNPVYMRDVETFLRFHFYQWNSRFTAALTGGEASSLGECQEVWSLDGRFWGRVQQVTELPSGVWLLRSPGVPQGRVVFRP
ncbi:MAG: alpha/beta hydrolase [Bacteroidia bacterium]|nr:alpha/beta hydrolase [Bacteroidia bacterium]MDW8088153.1 alpha/beta hydrolase [Bacteroidia bacterium]